MYSACMTLEDIERTVRKKLAHAPTLGARIKFNFGDDGIIFIDGTQNPAIVNNEDTEADTVFICSAEIFQNIINGSQDPTMAFMTGKLKIEGSMGHALKLNALFED